VLSAFCHRFSACLLLILGAFSALAQPPENTIVVIGDSLSAGYGMAADQGWVALLGRRVHGEFPGWQVVNASISGETSAGGAARVGAVIARHHPSVVVIELGANDGLRGLPLEALRSNLAQMVEAVHEAGAHVLLLGMRMPPNLGADYTAGFARIYQELADEYSTALLPFLLEPVAHERDAFQGDNIHPTAAVQARLLDHVWPLLQPLIGCVPGTPTAQCKGTLTAP